MEYTGTNNESAWNMSQQTLMRLDQLLQRASYYYSIANLNKFFFEWKNIKINAQFKFSSKQRGFLKLIEQKYLKEKTAGMRWAVAEKYSEVLLDYLHEYGMLLPSKKDSVKSAY